MTTNLLVAIAIPLRSLIKPTSANFTASVRNTASGVDSKLRKTYENRRQHYMQSSSKTTSLSN